MKVKDVVESVGTLSHKSTRYDDPEKSSVVNKKEREDLANYKRTILANFDKKINDDIFQGKLRLYMPLEAYKAPVIGGVHAVEAYRNILPVKITMRWNNVELDRLSMIDTFRSVQKSIIRAGYEMENYIENQAVKKVETQRGTKEQKTSISKVLSKVGDPTLVDFFNNDPVRTGSSAKDVQIVISRHPHDVGGMSTHRSWDSCMNLRKGVYRDKVPNDIKHGTMVAYLIDKRDRKIENPKARIAIKPFVNVNDPTDIALGVEGKSYGQSNPSFEATVVKWADAVNATRVRGKGKFELPHDLYNDSRNYMYYGIKTDYPEGSIAHKLVTREISPAFINEEKMSPDVLNVLLDMQAFMYCKLPRNIDPEQYAGYVNVLVNHLRSHRSSTNILNIVTSSTEQLENDVVQQVYGKQPLTQEEHAEFLEMMKTRPSIVSILPKMLVTPDMVLAGMDSPYFNTDLIRPQLFYTDPEMYFKILDKCIERFKHFLSPIYNMPKDVWGNYSNRARKCFLEGLYNDPDYIKYYFDMIKSVTYPETRHQVVEFIFQYTPSSELVAAWKNHCEWYPDTAQLELIPLRYLKVIVPEIMQHSGAMLSVIPDFVFNEDRELYDELVQLASNDLEGSTLKYIKNPEIAKHYEPFIAQHYKIRNESIDRIKELVGYKI